MYIDINIKIYKDPTYFSETYTHCTRRFLSKLSLTNSTNYYVGRYNIFRIIAGKLSLPIDKTMLTNG